VHVENRRRDRAGHGERSPRAAAAQALKVLGLPGAPTIPPRVFRALTKVEQSPSGCSLDAPSLFTTL
jgi:hypothetical protein